MSRTAEPNRAIRALLWALAVVAFVFAVGVVARIAVTTYTTDLSASGGAFWDFRDAGYYPVRAFLDGVLPYDVGSYLARYPVAQEYPLLPPTYMVLHAPLQAFGLLPASIVLLVLNLCGLTLLSAWSLALSRYRVTPILVLAVSALVIISNGGRNALYSGQVTVVFAAGAYLALTATGTGAGAVGIFFALVKPAIGLPTTLLVAAMGRYRRAVLGALAAAAASLALMLPFVRWAGGVAPLLEILSDNAAFSAASQWVSLETTTARIDIPATLAVLFNVVSPGVVEIAIAVAVFGCAGLVLFTKRAILAHGGFQDAAIVLVCVATITGMYHAFYDLVILVLPTMLLTRRDFAGGATPRPIRWAMLGALLLAAFNPFRIDMVAQALSGSPRMVEILGTGLTGASLAFALALALMTVWRLPIRVIGHIVQSESD